MEIKSKQEIYDAIVLYLFNNGGVFSDWFVGVTADPENRLFNEHKVNKEKGLWIYRKASCLKDALIVKEALVTSQKINAVSSTTNRSSVYVYAYKKKNGNEE